MTIELPKPIADYVAANARLDVDGMMQPFTPDAVVLDAGIGKRFEGPPRQESFDGCATQALGATADKHPLAGELRRINRGGHAYLASDRAAAIHGAEFIIDGGTVQTV